MNINKCCIEMGGGAGTCGNAPAMNHNKYCIKINKY